MTVCRYFTGIGFRALPRLFIFSVALLCLAAPSVSDAEVVDRIVAIINNSVITLSELNAATALALEKIPAADRGDAKKTAEAKSLVLDGLIEQKLVKQASDKAGIEVSEREIDNAIDDIKRQNNNMTHEGLMLALARSGLTYKEYREQLKEQIRQVKFINKEFRSKISIEDVDIEDYYRQRFDEFYGPASYRLNMIYVSNGESSKGRLKAVTEGIARGEGFKELARRYSEGHEAANGGEMGVMKSGEMNRSIEAAASKLKPGMVSPPIQTPDGTYLIQLVESIPPAPRPMEEIKAQIHDRLYKKIMDGRFNFWLSEVKKYANVEIRM
ncbi:MAG: SurA N-terminal domain-containing protein [Deltaproteobacteria bacterium]|nr:SurA N-terminal domain-containing protein [Deltaproteobacteria bacterium]